MRGYLWAHASSKQLGGSGEKGRELLAPKVIAFENSIHPPFPAAASDADRRSSRRWKHQCLFTSWHLMSVGGGVPVGGAAADWTALRTPCSPRGAWSPPSPRAGTGGGQTLVTRRGWVTAGLVPLAPRAPSSGLAGVSSTAPEAKRTLLKLLRSPWLKRRVGTRACPPPPPLKASGRLAPVATDLSSLLVFILFLSWLLLCFCSLTIEQREQSC